MSDEKKWYDDHQNLWLCAAVMRALDDNFDVLYFLEKPWKWTDEWRAIEGLKPGLSVEEMAITLAEEIANAIAQIEQKEGHK